MPSGSTGRFVSTGVSKTSCTGCSTSASQKIAAENEQATPRKTSPSSTESPSTCSNKTNPPPEESREKGSKQAWHHLCLAKIQSEREIEWVCLAKIPSDREIERS